MQDSENETSNNQGHQTTTTTTKIPVKNQPEKKVTCDGYAQNNSQNSFIRENTIMALI